MCNSFHRGAINGAEWTQPAKWTWLRGNHSQATTVTSYKRCIFIAQSQGILGTSTKVQMGIQSAAISHLADMNNGTDVVVGVGTLPESTC